MTGKEKCRMLREIRAKIAAENGLQAPEDTCTHEGPCAGTCPACDEEARQLESALARRASLGKRVALVGLCAGVAVAAAGCSILDAFSPAELTGVVPAPTEEAVLMGEIAAPEPIEGEIAAGEDGE